MINWYIETVGHLLAVAEWKSVFLRRAFLFLFPITFPLWFVTAMFFFITLILMMLVTAIWQGSVERGREVWNGKN